MSYAAQSDLVARYGSEMLIELTDRADPPAGTIDASVVTQALTDADAVINGYLLGRYTLPLATTPPLLKDLAVPIAVYKLHRDTVSEKVRLDYQDALKMLSQIAAGAVRLTVAGIEPAASGASGVRTTDRARPLTPENLKGFI
ncbi:gp436 family protein [Bradyrhizobium sp. HKCCYLR20261]|uniref:gp436 family protein n=1 Tax=Bradyrhizobium sp. HKCCYLR20261 TaxID=3420760 RepID=UPI003EBBB940